MSRFENRNSIKESAENRKIVTPAQVDYKDVRYLQKFVSERGKIIPSRVSNMPIKKQRELAKAIKRARVLALLPFVNK